jgi:hypothetical protein
LRPVNDSISADAAMNRLKRIEYAKEWEKQSLWTMKLTKLVSRQNKIRVWVRALDDSISTGVSPLITDGLADFCNLLTVLTTVLFDTTSKSRIEYVFI